MMLEMVSNIAMKMVPACLEGLRPNGAGLQGLRLC